MAEHVPRFIFLTPLHSNRNEKNPSRAPYTPRSDHTKSRPPTLSRADPPAKAFKPSVAR